MSTSTRHADLVKLASYWGVYLATDPVCRGHSAPIELLDELVLGRPPLTLWVGPRGGGKSFVTALATWYDSQLYDDHGTRILGGSRAQSGQVYEALRQFDRVHPRRSPLMSFTKTEARFRTGSEVSILAASSTAVRGPHVSTLRLDEVDEIDADIRESAMGMAMQIRGIKASISMTSTWHRVGGPMTELMERAKAGTFPAHAFCVFEILERCPESRSGRNLENCSECPLRQWCHSDIEEAGKPKAKRSCGHYAIDSLIQKVSAVSQRVFESDYLCLGPRAAGVWFKEFDDGNIREAAEYDPTLPVHLAIDSGVWTAAVLFQYREDRGNPRINVFGEFLAEGYSAETAALEIKALIDERCYAARRRVSTDSAGGARNPVGPTVMAEYERAGLRGDRGLETWPKYPGSVTNQLATVEALVQSADGSRGLMIHPRCVRLIEAMRSYTRAKRAGQWQDYPEDPQHPHEDLVDALRGGTATVLPEGRRVQPAYARVKAGRVF